MKAWLVFVVGGIGTYLIRASFLALGSRVTLPAWSQRAVRHVGPAVFAAIVTPPLFGSEGVAGLGQRRPEVLAAALAALVAWRTGKVAWVLAVGMVALWTLRGLGL